MDWMLDNEELCDVCSRAGFAFTSRLGRFKNY